MPGLHSLPSGFSWASNHLCFEACPSSPYFGSQGAQEEPGSQESLGILFFEADARKGLFGVLFCLLGLISAVLAVMITMILISLNSWSDSCIQISKIMENGRDMAISVWRLAPSLGTRESKPEKKGRTARER